MPDILTVAVRLFSLVVDLAQFFLPAPCIDALAKDTGSTRIDDPAP